MNEAVKFGLVLSLGIVLGMSLMYLVSLFLMWKAWTQR